MDVRIGYAQIYVSDLAKAVDFYHRLLGLPLLFRDDDFHYARLDAGPIRVGLAAVPPDADNFPSLVGRLTGIGLVVEDVDVAYEELSAKGVAFPMVPVDQPWGGRMGLLADPDGNQLYLNPRAEMS